MASLHWLSSVLNWKAVSGIWSTLWSHCSEILLSDPVLYYIFLVGLLTKDENLVTLFYYTVLCICHIVLQNVIVLKQYIWMLYDLNIFTFYYALSCECRCVSVTVAWRSKVITELKSGLKLDDVLFPLQKTNIQ